MLNNSNLNKCSSSSLINFNLIIIYFIGIILIFLICQSSAKPSINNFPIFKKEEQQFEHQMKKRFYAWDEMSAKRSLIPSARALSQLGINIIGYSNNDNLIGEHLLEEQQKQFNNLIPNNNNNIWKRGMLINFPSEQSSINSAAAADNLINFQHPFLINRRMIFDE